MTITVQRLLTELGRRAWSGFNKDDMVFSSEDADQAKAELNASLRYLINLVDFPFRGKEKTVITSNNMTTFSMPVGQITNIYNADTRESLLFVGDNSTYDKETKGTPSHYWIESKNPSQKVRLYPIPDGKYEYKVAYSQYMPVLTEDGDTKFEFENETDYINMPENLEYLFMDALIMRTMATNNKDQEDENYVPMLNEFNEAWRVFLRACKPVKKDKRVIWNVL